MTDRSEPRFVADAMLGTLARWLRLLGYDTLYDGRASDSRLVYLARSEGRILLTRDRPLAGRQGVRSLLIESQVLGVQLRQVTRAFALRADAARRRCSVCNGRLGAAASANIAARVPPYVLRTQTEFRECLSCGRVYWPGTHWQQLEEKLAQFF